MMAYFEFTGELHQLLLALDKDLYGYEADDFDYNELRARVDQVHPCLEKIAGYRLIRDEMQDCSYVFILGVWKISPEKDRYCSLFEVTFSCFGNLATVGSSYPRITISRKTKEDTARCLEEYGFVFLDADVLRRVMYDGKREYFLREGYTWLDRYFGCD